MATAAFKGFTLNYDTDGTPTWSAVGEVLSVSGIGKTNALIDATSADSGNDMEYIGGMADGQEITVECNRVLANTVQAAVIADVDAANNGAMQLAYDDGTTQETLTFDVVFISWSDNPSFTDKNTISFTMKISGGVVRA